MGEGSPYIRVCTILTIYDSYPIRHHVTYAVEAASLNILMFQKFLLVTATQTDTDAVVFVTESSLILIAHYED
jgi:hypothetical protein